MLNLIKKLLPGHEDAKQHLRHEVIRAKLQQEAAALHGAVQSLRYCCNTDQPYLVRYVKDDTDGRPFVRSFRWFDSQKIYAQDNGPTSATAQRYANLSFGDCNWEDEICPWCGAKGIVVCRDELVCRGRVQQKQQGDYFRCRDSCGASGWLQPCDATMTITRETDRQASRAATLPHRGQKPQGGNRTSVPPANTNKTIAPSSNRRLLK